MWTPSMMYRAHARRARRLLALTLLLGNGALADPAPPVAAHVDADAISLQSVDALAPALVRDIHARLAAVAYETVRELANGHELRSALPGPAELETQLVPHRIIAWVDRKPLLAADLERHAALRLYRLRGELDLERRRQLETLIDRSLLRAEARRRHVSLQALEALLARPEPVTDAELRAFAASEHAARRPAPDPERARPYLEFRKRHERRASLLLDLRKHADIRIHLQAPPRPRLSVDTDGGLSLTAAAGSVLVVYTNYRCSLCRATHHELDRLITGEHAPHIVLRDFVSRGDSAAIETAALVRCAARHRKLAIVRGAVLHAEGTPELNAVAKLVGMTSPALRACAESAEIHAQIERDTQAALRLGFEEAPAFVADGYPLSGMQTAEQLRRALATAKRP